MGRTTQVKSLLLLYSKHYTAYIFVVNDFIRTPGGRVMQHIGLGGQDLLYKPHNKSKGKVFGDN